VFLFDPVPSGKYQLDLLDDSWKILRTSLGKKFPQVELQNSSRCVQTIIEVLVELRGQAH